MESILEARKHRASDKRVILKDQLIYTTSKILKQLQAAEKSTAKWKKKVSKRASKKCRVVTPEVLLSPEDTDDQIDHESEEEDREIMDEIVVEMPR